MVASLQDTSLEEECFTQALQQQQESRNTAAALPLSHEAAMKWFYKDPQGEIQGTLWDGGTFSHLRTHTSSWIIIIDSLAFLWLFGFLFKRRALFSLSVRTTRSIYHSGDVWVVPGWLFHHDSACKAGLRRGLPTPGGRHQDVGPGALRSGALPAAPAGETAPTNAAPAAHPGARRDCESELSQHRGWEGEDAE